MTMGQYHKVVNYSKKEFLHPHKLGAGLKMWEQFVNQVSTPQAIFLLLCTSNNRGGGDLNYDEWHPKANPEGVLGRWAGDRIAVIGDYSEPSDLPTVSYEERGQEPPNNSHIYNACGWSVADGQEDEDDGPNRELGKWTDISDLIIPIFEAEFGIKFTGEEGWRHFERDPEAGWSILPEPAGAKK